jgi:hypothetical protein
LLIVIDRGDPGAAAICCAWFPFVTDEIKQFLEKSMKAMKSAFKHLRSMRPAADQELGGS